MIKWEDKSDPDTNDISVFGYTKDKFTYIVANRIGDSGDQIVADKKVRGEWLDLDVPVDSIEEGKQLCEMWEATGAYD